jgi:hypothetical protein
MRTPTEALALSTFEDLLLLVRDGHPLVGGEGVVLVIEVDFMQPRTQGAEYLTSRRLFLLPHRPVNQGTQASLIACLSTFTILIPRGRPLPSPTRQPQHLTRPSA